MSGADFAVLGLIIAILALAVSRLVINMKGRGASCPGCAGCPMDKKCTGTAQTGGVIPQQRTVISAHRKREK